MIPIEAILTRTLASSVVFRVVDLPVGENTKAEGFQRAELRTGFFLGKVSDQCVSSQRANIVSLGHYCN